MNCYLIGTDVSHSRSPAIHAAFGRYAYGLRQLAPVGLASFLETEDFDGLNVTLPFKREILPYLDAVDPHAAAIGAVNTVVCRGGKRIGYNTDYLGLRGMLERAGFELRGRKVLILGTGGTSRTAAAVAEDCGAATIIRVSRTGREGAVTYAQAAASCGNFDYLINTTPVGKTPEPDACPISLAPFSRLQGVADVLYNPLRTRLVLEAQARGIPAVGGLEMLVRQAAASCALFTGLPVAEQTVRAVCQRLGRELENLVLIGMPGSGKTTIGRLLAQKTGLRFVDSDEEAASVAGKPIPELIREAGEAPFRALEAAVLSDLSRKSGLVIATGGGAVLDADNVRRLRQNGRLIFLDRPLSDLAPDDAHPLSDTQAKLTALYAARHPIYAACADRTVSGFPDPQAAAEAVYALWKEDK